MGLYIPFIHKILKKEKFVQIQIPLYIEKYIPSPKEIKKEEIEELEEKESITIIDLF